MIKLHTPLTIEKLSQLKAGQEVLLSGIIYTGRDAAHKRLQALFDENKPMPFDIEDATIFYVGPTPNKPNQIFGSGGPTTSGRMDAYAPMLLENGLRSMIGKGYRSEEVKAAIVANGGTYFGAIGGAGAIISDCVKSAEIIAFEDLGPEAIRQLEIKDMPLVVLYDAHGNDLYTLGRQDYLESRNKNGI